MNRKMNNIYVIGTDTGAGKTVLSLLLMQYFYEKGFDPFYIKAIQTGCIGPYDVDSDAGFVYNNLRQLEGKDPADSVPICFRNPKAPYFAARDEGKDIDLKLVLQAVEKRNRSHSPIILEAAGGVLVPIDEETMMIDTINMFDAGPIIAARAGLGTINHTLLTLEALNNRDIRPLGIVFIDSTENEISVDMINENVEAVEKASAIKVAGVIHKITDFSNPDKECFQPFDRIFGDKIG
ncbi:MAG: dethiobiotin synthase [Desulfobacterales bacterium]|nr:dethiobiotin synthase [Desulfobacterales bacterium]